MQHIFPFYSREMVTPGQLFGTCHNCIFKLKVALNIAGKDLMSFKV